jgi:hypothetical protein
MKSTTLYLLSDRKEICVYADSGSFKEIVSIISHADVNPPGKASFDQIAGGLRVTWKVETQCEIVECPKRHDGQRHFGPDEGGGDLPHSAIAACNYDERRSLTYSFRCPIEEFHIRIHSHFFEGITDCGQAVANL